jgi:putative nucleotide binding protein
MEEFCYILDFLPNGRPDDPKRRGPLAYAIGESAFTLFELIPKPGATLLVGDRVYIGREPEQRTHIDRVRGRVRYEDMTHNAQSEMSFVIEQIVRSNEPVFLKLYNEGGPISTRMHVLELLPGLGKKLMTAILQERKSGPFASFHDLDERVKALHQPEKLIAHRIEMEIKDPSQKYHLFVRPPARDDEYGGGHGPPGHEQGPERTQH